MSKFKVGMDVFDLRHGWGKVIYIESSMCDYPVRVRYHNECSAIGYTKEGKWEKKDTHPCLLLPSEIPKEWLKCYPKPLTKREEIVYVNSYENKSFIIYYEEEDAIANARNLFEGKTCKATLIWEE